MCTRPCRAGPRPAGHLFNTKLDTERPAAVAVVHRCRQDASRVSGSAEHTNLPATRVSKYHLRSYIGPALVEDGEPAAGRRAAICSTSRGDVFQHAGPPPSQQGQAQPAAEQPSLSASEHQRQHSRHHTTTRDEPQPLPRARTHVAKDAKTASRPYGQRNPNTACTAWTPCQCGQSSLRNARV